MVQEQSLNKIFFGSYCTGKTFRAIIEALRVTGSKNINSDPQYIYSKDEIRKLMDEFEEKRRLGIIEFVAFHESYAYDDFIEGINPYVKEYDKLSLPDDNAIRDGIFKRIANDALFECIDVGEEKKKSLYNFRNFIEGFKTLYPIGSVMQTFKGDFTIVRYLEKFIVVKPSQNSSMIQLKLSVFKEMLASTVFRDLMYSSLDEENRTLQEILDEYKEESTYYYAIFSELRNLSSVIKIKLIEEFYKGHYSLKSEDVSPYVIIIDEINHADIPKLFGEVLSLVDKNSRGDISATLLYSQKRFVLPKNLYILETMNTTEMINPSVYKDLRHFEFIDTEPNPDLVADFGCDFSKKFDVMNKKLSILLGKKYRLGHCYFLKSDYENADITVLKNIWLNNILPLLSVYFNNDWEKLQLLLGKAKNNNAFITKIDGSIMLANFLENNQMIYEFADLRDENCDFEKVLNNAFSDIGYSSSKHGSPVLKEFSVEKTLS